MPHTAIRPIDEVRRKASQQLDLAKKSKLGQFMTPTAIADYMASLFTHWPSQIRLLDPGAGVGSLIEALAERFVTQAPLGAALEVSAYEIDPLLARYLKESLQDIASRVNDSERTFNSTIHERDFIAEATFALGFGGQRFTHAILNPPYKKINTNSDHRRLLRTVGIETVNLYTAFLGLSIALLEKGGEVVAIMPRSFCNGTYFRPFREYNVAARRACSYPRF